MYMRIVFYGILLKNLNDRFTGARAEAEAARVTCLTRGAIERTVSR